MCFEATPWLPSAVSRDLSVIGTSTRGRYPGNGTCPDQHRKNDHPAWKPAGEAPVNHKVNKGLSFVIKHVKRDGVPGIRRKT